MPSKRVRPTPPNCLLPRKLRGGYPPSPSMAKIGIGVIGAGGIANLYHLPAYQALSDQCELVAICDVNLEQAKKIGANFGIENVYSDYREMLKSPEVHAVSVTTPNSLHYGPTIDALKAGKHVLCEKPLAMNAEEARQMCRVAKDEDRVLQVALQKRFIAPMQFVKQYIDSGAMGDIYFARAQALRRRGVPSWGVFIEKDKQGGGPLIDIGVHILDMTLFLMGYPKPVSAFGQTWDKLGKNPELFNSWGDYDRSKFSVEDFAVGLIKFENGAAISLESSFMGNMEEDVYQTQVYGTKSGALVKGMGNGTVQIFTETNRQLFNMTPVNLPQVEAENIAEVRAFVNAIANGTPSPVPGENGLVLNAIFDAIYKSSETGREERVDVEF